MPPRRESRARARPLARRWAKVAVMVTTAMDTGPRASGQRRLPARSQDDRHAVISLHGMAMVFDRRLPPSAPADAAGLPPASMSRASAWSPDRYNMPITTHGSVMIFLGRDASAHRRALGQLPHPADDRLRRHGVRGWNRLAPDLPPGARSSRWWRPFFVQGAAFGGRLDQLPAASARRNYNLHAARLQMWLLAVALSSSPS